MTSRKTMYWIIGIIAAVIAAMAVWNTMQHYARYQQSRNSSHGEHGSMSPGTPMAETPSDMGLALYLKEQDAIMADMVQSMKNVETSGNASLDFLQGMIPHHASAIAMADSYLQNGAKDPSLKEIAQNIKTAQTREITQMNEMIQRLRTSGAKEDDKAKAHWQAYQSMLAKHHDSHALPADTTDEAFAEGMIVHHQMAVDMARDVLPYANDSEVRALAETVIASQEQEIRQMQEIKNTLEAQKSDPAQTKN